ncbi:anti-sigma factor domain-containing protein [Cohnella cellulosilytica]|uniref:Anti-sigma factor domain-containing protein n=1 Tax=Cohnella cellulosilytica TaxID=986710 RepID=A0ABW2F145_9BACL
MLGRDCGIPDERWIDYHLGNLGRAAAEALERHAESCSVCRGACKIWAELLGVPSEQAVVVCEAAETIGSLEKSEKAGVRETAGENGGRQKPVEAAGGPKMPAPRVYRSLRRRMALLALIRRAKRRPGRMAAACACALLLGVALIGLLKYPSAQEEPAVASALDAQHYARLHEPEGARLMELPGTRVVSSTDIAAWPVASSAIKPRRSLTVWINVDTKELFVLMEGVLESDASDVQAWADSSSRLSNLGLLEFHSGQGHLYSHFREMTAPDALRFTIEPKGGSELPTTPDSAHVRLASVEE